MGTLGALRRPRAGARRWERRLAALLPVPAVVRTWHGTGPWRIGNVLTQPRPSPGCTEMAYRGVVSGGCGEIPVPSALSAAGRRSERRDLTLVLLLCSRLSGRSGRVTRRCTKWPFRSPGIPWTLPGRQWAVTAQTLPDRLRFALPLCPATLWLGFRHALCCQQDGGLPVSSGRREERFECGYRERELRKKGTA